MANQPDDPHRPNPDENPPLAFPPKSKAPTDDPDSDSAIDFAKLGEGDVSGISMDEWAALVAEPRSTESKLSIDAPSDMDLLSQLADKGESVPEEKPVEEKDIAEMIAQAEAEFRLEDEPPAPISARAADEDALFADMMAESIDLVGDQPSGKFVEEADGNVVIDTSSRDEAEADPSSFVDLGATALIEEDIVDLGSGAIVDVAAQDLDDRIAPESGAIDLGEDAIIVDAASGAIDLGEDAIIVDATSGVIELGDDAVIVDTGSGTIDLEADAVIVDAAAEPAGPSDANDLGMDAYFDEEPANDLESASAEVSKDEVIDIVDDFLATEEVTDSVDPLSGGIDLTAVGSALSQGDSSRDMLGDDILLEQPNSPAPKKGRTSRDFIAEELESGTDLRDARKRASKKDQDADLDDFLNATARTDESSMVDLGSSGDLSLFDEAQRSKKSRGAQGADSDIRIEDIPDIPPTDEDYADIDLEKIEAVAPKKGKQKPEPATIDTDELESFAEGEMAATAAPDEEAPIAKKGKKAKPVVEEDEEEEAPKKKKEKVKAGGKGGAWVGGTFLGTLIGIGACVGLLFAGVIPPEYLGYLGIQPAGEKKVTDSGTGTPTPPSTTFDRTVNHIRGGDLDQVKPDDLAKADENKPDDLVARAEFQWLNYLRAERGKDPRAALKADAEPVKLALADIEKALKGDSPDAKANALFLRGQIQELTGNQAGARGTYAEGAKEFPAQKARFENAILLIELTGRAMALPPGLPREVLVALLVLFQPPAGGEPDEAGYRFWQALKLAREGKSVEAIKALDEARAAHDLRRFLYPRKPQNPKSDPREEIFLKACDELRLAWANQGKLKNEAYLEADAKDRIPEVDKLLDKATETAKAEQLKGLAKLFEGKKVDKVDDLVGLVAAERKAAGADKLAQKTKLDDQQKKLDKLEDDAKVAQKKIEATEKSLKETQAIAKKAKDESEAAIALLGQVGKAVGSDFTDVKASREPLLREVREAVRIAKVVDPRGTIRQLESDLAVDRAKLAQRWNPSEMLGFWVPILQKDRDRKDLADRAAIDVKRVLDDPASKDAAKAHALLVQGLVERNAEKYAEAKATLTRARDGLVGGKADWLTVADEALREVSDPAAYIAKRARQLENSGKKAEAIAVLDRGLKVLPDRKGPLYLQKARTSLESARSKGPIKATDPLVQSAQKDAAEAAKEGLPEGYFLAGRIDEELGRFKEAETNYRAAIKAHGKNDAEGSRFDIALARVLLKQIARGSARLAAPSPKTIDLETAFVLSLLTFQVGDLPADRPAATAEADKIADRIIANKDAPFDALAQAYAIKGLHTRALQVYTAGLRDTGVLPAEYANTLLDLINAHPYLIRRESLTTADPTQAEKYYASGMGFYNARKYASAEKEFLSAVENDKADARYFYFLGLSRLAQGKRDAYEDFEQGARLEQQGKPGRAAVSISLERVQGPLRAALNEVRSRPIRERTK